MDGLAIVALVRINYSGRSPRRAAGISICFLCCPAGVLQGAHGSSGLNRNLCSVPTILYVDMHTDMVSSDRHCGATFPIVHVYRLSTHPERLLYDSSAGLPNEEEAQWLNGTACWALSRLRCLAPSLLSTMLPLLHSPKCQPEGGTASASTIFGWVSARWPCLVDCLVVCFEPLSGYPSCSHPCLPFSSLIRFSCAVPSRQASSSFVQVIFPTGKSSPGAVGFLHQIWAGGRSLLVLFRNGFSTSLSVQPNSYRVHRQARGHGKKRTRSCAGPWNNREVARRLNTKTIPVDCV